jgi:predicted RNA-binding protein with PUA-like domain
MAARRKTGAVPAKKTRKATPVRAARQAKAVSKAPMARPALKALPAAVAGERRYWLIKTEPEVFSFHDMQEAPNATTHWDGVRNYQARNYLRDHMKAGDGVLVYHSNADPPAIAGVATIVREGYPDHTQFDPAHHHYDPEAKPEAPRWFMVDVKAGKALGRPLPLPELRSIPGLQRMVLLQKGSRLSVQPVTAAEWDLITRLGGI